MEKNLNINEIAFLNEMAHLTQGANEEATHKIIKNYFRAAHIIFCENDLDNLAYAELIKKTIKNMTYLPAELNKNIYMSIYGEFDLNKVAKYYKLSEELVNATADNLWEDFLIKKENIYKVDDLWRKLDIDLKTNGIKANLLHLVDKLLKFQDDVELPKIEYVQIDEEGSPKIYRSSQLKFVNWLSSQDLEKYIMPPYNKADFIKEFKLEEKYYALKAKNDKALFFM